MIFFCRLPKARHVWGDWHRAFAFKPVTVRIVRHPSDPKQDRGECVWLGWYWRRYIETAAGNWAGGHRYVVEHAPAWTRRGNDGLWASIQPYHTPEHIRWRSEERGK